VAYETKIIFRLLAEAIGRTKTVEEAYTVIVQSASVEGVILPSYEEFQAQLKKQQE